MKVGPPPITPSSARNFHDGLTSSPDIGATMPKPSVAFLALAAGSILYVVIQLMNVNQKLGYKTLVAWMLLAGLFLGFATDFIIEAAGV